MGINELMQVVEQQQKDIEELKIAVQKLQPQIPSFQSYDKGPSSVAEMLDRAKKEKAPWQ